MALLHGPEQIADLPVPVAESPGAVRIGHPERSHLVEYLAPNSVFNHPPRGEGARPMDRSALTPPRQVLLPSSVATPLGAFECWCQLAACAGKRYRI